jgi:hypothetical protein
MPSVASSLALVCSTALNLSAAGGQSTAATSDPSWALMPDSAMIVFAISASVSV